MSSKKKRRYQAYLIRKRKRDAEKLSLAKYNERIQNGTIEEMAESMGIKLK